MVKRGEVKYLRTVLGCRCKYWAIAHPDQPSAESRWTCSYEIADPTISTDDLNARMSEKPIGKNLLVTAQKNLNWSVLLQIYE
jgi:hypothetical protein